MMLSSVPVHPRRYIPPLTCGYGPVRAGRCPGRSRRPAHLPGNRPASLPGQAPDRTAGQQRPDGQAGSDGGGQQRCPGWPWRRPGRAGPGTVPPGHCAITLLTSVWQACAGPRDAGGRPGVPAIRRRPGTAVDPDQDTGQAGHTPGNRTASCLSCAVSRVSALAAVRVPAACRPGRVLAVPPRRTCPSHRGAWLARAPASPPRHQDRPVSEARHVRTPPLRGTRASHQPCARPRAGNRFRAAPQESHRAFSHGRSAALALSRHRPALVRKICPEGK